MKIRWGKQKLLNLLPSLGQNCAQSVRNSRLLLLLLIKKRTQIVFCYFLLGDEYADKWGSETDFKTITIIVTKQKNSNKIL